MDRKTNIEKTLYCSTLVLLGSLVLAFGIYNFNWQNNITEGGILGLLLLFEHLFDISPSITNIIFDIVAFGIGAKYFGKKFLYYSLLCTGSFSAFYWVFEQSAPIIPALDGNMLAASLLAGLFVGIGVGLVVKGGGAAGGDDVIAIVVSKFTKWTLSQVYLFSDVIILSLSLVYLNTAEIFWSLIAVYVSSKTICFIYNHTSNTITDTVL